MKTNYKELIERLNKMDLSAESIAQFVSWKKNQDQAKEERLEQIKKNDWDRSFGHDEWKENQMVELSTSNEPY